MWENIMLVSFLCGHHHPATRNRSQFFWTIFVVLWIQFQSTQ